MPRTIDLTGRKFYRLTAISRGDSRPKEGREWNCQCECGNLHVVLAKRLIGGKVKSCGCGAGGMNNGKNKRCASNGAWRSNVYRNWSQMIWRCRSPNSKFPKYVALGVCDRWLVYENFVADMGPKPSPKHTIDRIDNTKGYSPENCRWATNKEQCNNKSTNRLFIFNDETKTMTQWAEQYGIPFHTLKSRINRSKWSIERALTEPLDRFGQKYNTAERGAKKHHQLPK